MMNERGKSDPAAVAAKLANKAERSAAEPVEPRAGTKGIANQQHTGRTQSRETVPQVLARIRQTARERKKERFTALFHHINVELLRTAFSGLKQDAAPGVDGLIWEAYAANLEANLQDLHARVQRGAYRALPSRRQYIPKPDGRQRPLAVAAPRLSNGRRPHCLTRSTRRTSSDSRTGSGPDAAPIMRWMRSWSESGAGE
jgi:RNA-directed DNA polymerase